MPGCIVCFVLFLMMIWAQNKNKTVIGFVSDIGNFSEDAKEKVTNPQYQTRSDFYGHFIFAFIYEVGVMFFMYKNTHWCYNDDIPDSSLYKIIWMTKLGYSGCDQRNFCCYLRPCIFFRRLFASDGASISIETVQKTGISTLSSKSNNSNSPVRLSNPNSGSNPSSKSGSGNNKNNNKNNKKKRRISNDGNETDEDVPDITVLLNEVMDIVEAVKTPTLRDNEQGFFKSRNHRRKKFSRNVNVDGKHVSPMDPDGEGSLEDDHVGGDSNIGDDVVAVNNPSLPYRQSEALMGDGKGNGNDKNGNSNNNDDDDDDNQRDLTPQISVHVSHSDHDEKESDYDDSAPPTPTQRHDSVRETSTKENLRLDEKDLKNQDLNNIDFAGKILGKRKKGKAKKTSQTLQKQTREKANNNELKRITDERDETQYGQLKNKEETYAPYMNGVSVREKSLVSAGVALDNNNNSNNNNNNSNGNEFDVGNGLGDDGNAHGINTFKKIYKLPTEQITLVIFEFEDVLCTNMKAVTHKTAKDIANTDLSKMLLTFGGVERLEELHEILSNVILTTADVTCFLLADHMSSTIFKVLERTDLAQYFISVNRAPDGKKKKLSHVIGHDHKLSKDSEGKKHLLLLKLIRV